MIPFLDLRRQYAALAEPLEAAVLETLRGGSYVLGEAVENFEADFAARCGTRHAIAVNSGSSALHLALLTAGIGPGDEVITVPTTFVETVAAVLYVGAVPVLVDVDPETLTMDPARFEAAITPRTKAVLPVHFHGRLADMAASSALASACAASSSAIPASIMPSARNATASEASAAGPLAPIGAPSSTNPA